MEEKLICQSCSMPLEEKAHIGTNSDGSPNNDYCAFCFKDGAFTNNMTLEEMIADSVNYAEMAGMTKEDMLKHASEILPTLKRWTCSCTDDCANGCVCEDCQCEDCDCSDDSSSDCHCSDCDC